MLMERDFPNGITTIGTVHGPVNVYADCRVLIVDPTLVEDPAYDPYRSGPWLFPEDFSPAQIRSLTEDELLASWEAKCRQLHQRVERLESRSDEKSILLLIAGAIIVVLLIVIATLLIRG